jgi:hypothetical protein
MAPPWATQPPDCAPQLNNAPKNEKPDSRLPTDARIGVMPDDPRPLAGRLERLAAAVGIAPDELTKALESGGHYALEELISRAGGYDPDAAMRDTRRERYAYVNGKSVLKKKLPAPPQNAAHTIHRIRVDLTREKSAAWRRLEIPSAMTLDQMSRVLQAAFDWTESTMHEFETVYGRYAAPEHAAELPELDDRAAPEDEASVMLVQVIPAKNVRKISYVYTLRAYLRQAITLEEIRPAEPGVSYPRCTGGRRVSAFADGRRTRGRTAKADDEPFSTGRVTAALARIVK